MFVQLISELWERLPTTYAVGLSARIPLVVGEAPLIGKLLVGEEIASFPLSKQIVLSRVCLTRIQLRPRRPGWQSRIRLTRRHCSPVQVSRLGLTCLHLDYWLALGTYGCSSPGLLFDLGSDFAPD